MGPVKVVHGHNMPRRDPYCYHVVKKIKTLWTSCENFIKIY